MDKHQPEEDLPGDRVIPLHAEQIDVSKVQRETGKVRVSTTTHLREQVVDELLAEDHAHVKRVAIGTVVANMPEIRQEGDTTIIPIVEEVLVVERKLLLKQEIHVTRVRTTSSHHETVSLRYQEAVLERLPANIRPNNFEHNSSITEDKQMGSETIVAVYENASQAEAVIADLVASGVHSASIKHFSRDATDADITSMQTGDETGHRHGFWAWLTGHDNDSRPSHDVYDHSLQSGRTVVTVVSDGHNADQIYATLERHEPLDIDMQDSMTTTGAAYPTATTSRAETGYPDVAAHGTGYVDSASTVAPGVAAHGTGYVDSTSTAPGAAAPGTGYADGTSMADPGVAATGDSEEALTLSEESLVVGKRAVDRGTTRVRRYTVERPVEEHIRLRDETVSVFRRPISQTTDVGADAFHDHEITVTETDEEAVVAKTARVVEEVVVRKGVNERVETIHDTLRREEVEITGPTATKPAI